MPKNLVFLFSASTASFPIFRKVDMFRMLCRSSSKKTKQPPPQNKTKQNTRLKANKQKKLQKKNKNKQTLKQNQKTNQPTLRFLHVKQGGGEAFIFSSVRQNRWKKEKRSIRGCNDDTNVGIVQQFLQTNKWINKIK